MKNIKLEITTLLNNTVDLQVSFAENYDYGCYTYDTIGELYSDLGNVLSRWYPDTIVPVYTMDTKPLTQNLGEILGQVI